MRNWNQALEFFSKIAENYKICRTYDEKRDVGDSAELLLPLWGWEKGEESPTFSLERVWNNLSL